jgi:hypothetical protein
MASDDKKIKTNPAKKSKVPPNEKSVSGVDAKTEGGKITDGGKIVDAVDAKTEGGKIVDAVDAPPSGYSRGEGQKPVSKAYRDNWNTIFAKKKKR